MGFTNAQSNCLRGQRALVLGGSGGIGAEISRWLARSGADLILHGGNDADRLQALAAELDCSPGSIRPVLYPIHDLVETLNWTAQFSDIDILVLAFGPFLVASLEETCPEDWLRMTTLNLALPGAMVSAFAPAMAERGFGRILLFGGTDTDLPQSFKTVAAYSAAKAGLPTLARSAARRFGVAGVTVNVLCPGPVETEYQSESEKLHYTSILADGTMMKPSALIPVVALLLSDAGAVINGTAIRVDKGWDRR